jgi:hypothetical protein
MSCSYIDEEWNKALGDTLQLCTWKSVKHSRDLTCQSLMIKGTTKHLSYMFDVLNRQHVAQVERTSTPGQRISLAITGTKVAAVQ